MQHTPQHAIVEIIGKLNKKDKNFGQRFPFWPKPDAYAAVRLRVTGCGQKAPSETQRGRAEIAGRRAEPGQRPMVRRMDSAICA